MFLAGCDVKIGNVEGGDVEGGEIWDEIAKTQLLSVLGTVVLWAILGFLAALALVFLVFFSFRRLGWYALPGGGRRWVRVLIFIFMLLVLPILGGCVGVGEGVWRGAKHAAHESSLAKEWLPKGGGLCADSLAWVDELVCAQEKKKPAWQWAEFQEGKKGLPVQALILKLDDLKGEKAEQLGRDLRKKILENNPDWQGGKAEAMLDWILPQLTRALIERSVDKGIKKAGIQPFLKELAAAAEQGDDGRMTRAELSLFFTDEVLRPSVLYPVRVAVRKYQTGFLLGMLTVILLPVGLVKLVGYFMKRSSKPASLEGNPGGVKLNNKPRN